MQQSLPDLVHGEAVRQGAAVLEMYVQCPWKSLVPQGEDFTKHVCLLQFPLSPHKPLEGYTFSCKTEYFSAEPKRFDLEVLLIHYVGTLDELPRACFYFFMGRTCEGKFLVPWSTHNQDRAVGCTSGGGAT